MYLRLAQAGEVILVTRRNRVVARIDTASAGVEHSTDDANAALTRKGLLRPALRAPGRVPRSLGLGPTAEILSALDQDRRDR